MSLHPWNDFGGPLPLQVAHQKQEIVLQWVPTPKVADVRNMILMLRSVADGLEQGLERVGAVDTIEVSGRCPKVTRVTPEQDQA